MSIYYVLVAKRTDMILVDYTEYSGNFQQITIDLMKRIEPESRRTFELSEYLFHYINEDSLTILCMTSKEIQKKLAFAFLADVRKRLFDFYSPHELQNAKAFGLKTFGAELKEKVVSISPPYLPSRALLL
jgi:vesicle-associated membrane protein 7